MRLLEVCEERREGETNLAAASAAAKERRRPLSTPSGGASIDLPKVVNEVHIAGIMAEDVD